MGNSRGALLTLMVGVEQKGLKALVIMAPAEIGRYFSTTLSEVPSLDAPILLLVEASDESGIQNNFDTLDRILREHKKEARSICYKRGGGHNLFHTSVIQVNPTSTSIFDLSPSEKLQLVEDLWDDLAATPEAVPVHDWQKEELAHRKANLMKNPASGLTWEEVKQRVQSRYGR
jgi:putative addiction module component (TIGR02574 family)